jgi:copper(I)-binding protein
MSARRIALALAVALALALTAACSTSEQAAPDIEIVDAFMTPGDSTIAVYLTISNGGGPDEIIGAESSDVTELVTLHQAKQRDGLSVMEPTATIVVGGNSTTALNPGKAHLMLEALARPYDVGDEIPLEVTFERSGVITTTVQVIGADEALDRVVSDT